MRNDSVMMATVEDVLALEERMKEFIRDLFASSESGKEFYSPSEFAQKTGLKYHAVIKRCKKGQLKAHQDRAKTAWMIDASEIERLKEDARRNSLKYVRNRG